MIRIDLDLLKRKLKCRISYSRPFGDMVDLSSGWSGNAVIIAITKGCSGMIPIKFLLAHQVYVKDLASIIEEHDPREIYLLPVNTEDTVGIYERKS